MTPEHLPTEQYEAQLAEKVARLQSMMAPFSDLVPEVFRSPVSKNGRRQFMGSYGCISGHLTSDSSW